MSAEGKQETPFASIVILLFIILLLGGLWALFINVRVTGSATLPNGAVVAIDAGAGGFGVAENSKSTEINIAGLIVEFVESEIFVDGVKVGVTEDSITQLTLTVGRDGVVTLVSGDKTIVLSD